MGILQQAYETYTTMEKDYMGRYIEGQKEPLCPVSHIITAAQLEITLDQDGKFIQARAVDKSEPKIIIPATENSAGRTRALCAHPLCDQLGYLGGHDASKFELYVNQLSRWAASEWGVPKLNAVLSYVRSGTILKDLESAGLIKVNKKGAPEDEKLLVRWRILNPHSTEPEECWKDVKLFKSFADFYSNQQDKAVLCMVTGKTTVGAKQHPKGIIAINGNAKLISANDDSGFTYRGRFSEDWQAATVSYEVSQKAHAALRWVAVNQGVFYGGRTFLCWSPQGVKIQQMQTSRFNRNGGVKIKPSDYREELRKTLAGRKESLPKNAKAVVAAFDAATTGRLSLTYYNELQASDFLDRLHDWDAVCCWWNRWDEKYVLQSPELWQIVNSAFGVQRTEKNKPKLVTDDRVMAQQIQRLIACRVDGMPIPADILQALVNRASMPQAYDPVKWRDVVFVTCAVIQSFYSQKMKGDICMEWDLNRPDRSFQYGRLLAVMDRAEENYYYRNNEERQTNAIKSLSVFKQTPLDVFERVNRQLETAYLPRMKPGDKKEYYRLRDEIMGNILKCSTEQDINSKLSPFYLIGYELQRNTFFTKKDAADKEEE